MRNVRATLTRIKTGVTDKLPEDDDIFGFAGINKELILQALQECHGLIDGLEGRKETFDVIAFKREFAELGQVALDYLNSLPSSYRGAEKFNQFLSVLAQIRNKINMTFLLFVKESLRPESDLASIRKSLEELAPLHKEYQDKLQLFQDDCEIIATKSKNAIEEASQISSELTSIKERHGEITKQHETAVRGVESISELVAKMEHGAAEIERQEACHKEHEKAINEYRQQIKKQSTEIDTLGEQLEKNVQANSNFQEEIRLTIDDANRLSMAGSFKKRKEEINEIIKTSEKILVLVLILFGLVTFALFVANLEAGKIQYLNFLTKIPILTPFIWLAWFYTRKVGHLSRIGEDYSFKYAAAMAFEGYSKKCATDDELSKKLLDISIENMGANPIRLYGDGDVPSGPIPELVEKTSKLLDKVKENE